MPKILSRRSFLTSFHISWVASYATLILPACRRPASPATAVDTSKSPVAIPPQTRSDGFTRVGNVLELRQAGQVSYQHSNYQKVLVIRQPDNPTQLLAFDPTCPHQGCVVRWVPEERLFGCPCHGGEFNFRGQPTNGPPTVALPKYPVKIEQDQILVRLLVSCAAN